MTDAPAKPLPDWHHERLMLDKPGPRYTSYPTADRFKDGPFAPVYQDALHARQVGRLLRPIALYVHIPFCESVCYYCACNKVVSKNHVGAETYLKHLFREMELVRMHLEGSHQVAQIHFGGGSPTYLNDDQLELLLHKLEQTFYCTRSTERSIEIDPRTVDAARLERLKDAGFQRLSFGIQDFDPDVQHAIHRVQPLGMLRQLMHHAQCLQFESVNMDLIYGLPRQTPSTFSQTVNEVVGLYPDRIALYAYAHLPARFKPQRRIAESELPASSTRIHMLEQAIERLCGAGYTHIGMDHFAKPSDALAIAKRQGRLHRNFQGYTHQADCDVIGLGVSAISSVGITFSQNQKTLSAYYEAIASNTLPVMKAYVCSSDDLIRREVIMGLMCRGLVTFSDIEQAYWIPFNRYFEKELAQLKAYEHAGLLEMTPDALRVTASGWFAVRSLAMVFDWHLQHQDHRATHTQYSKVI